MKMMVDYAHDLLLEKMTQNCVACDFTMGNGYDTVFLCQHARKVYAFDIQHEALLNTTKRLEEANISGASYELIEDSHANCRRYLPFIDVGIFNLGYLPGFKHETTTRKDSTLKAVRESLDLLRPDGRLIIVCYPGHSEGKIESEALEQFASKLDSHDFHVMSLKMTNKLKSPYIICIDKVY